MPKQPTIQDLFNRNRRRTELGMSPVNLNPVAHTVETNVNAPLVTIDTRMKMASMIDGLSALNTGLKAFGGKVVESIEKEKAVQEGIAIQDLTAAYYRDTKDGRKLAKETSTAPNLDLSKSNLTPEDEADLRAGVAEAEEWNFAKWRQGGIEYLQKHGISVDKFPPYMRQYEANLAKNIARDVESHIDKNWGPLSQVNSELTLEALSEEALKGALGNPNATMQSAMGQNPYLRDSLQTLLDRKNTALNKSKSVAIQEHNDQLVSLEAAKFNSTTMMDFVEENYDKARETFAAGYEHIERQTTMMGRPELKQAAVARYFDNFVYQLTDAVKRGRLDEDQREDILDDMIEQATAIGMIPDDDIKTAEVEAKNAAERESSTKAHSPLQPLALTKASITDGINRAFSNLKSEEEVFRQSAERLGSALELVEMVGSDGETRRIRDHLRNMSPEDLQNMSTEDFDEIARLMVNKAYQDSQGNWTEEYTDKTPNLQEGLLGQAINLIKAEQANELHKFYQESDIGYRNNVTRPRGDATNQFTLFTRALTVAAQNKLLRQESIALALRGQMLKSSGSIAVVIGDPSYTHEQWGSVARQMSGVIGEMNSTDRVLDEDSGEYVLVPRYSDDQKKQMNLAFVRLSGLSSSYKDVLHYTHEYFDQEAKGIPHPDDPVGVAEVTEGLRWSSLEGLSDQDATRLRLELGERVHNFQEEMLGDPSIMDQLASVPLSDDPRALEDIKLKIQDRYTKKVNGIIEEFDKRADSLANVRKENVITSLPDARRDQLHLLKTEQIPRLMSLIGPRATTHDLARMSGQSEQELLKNPSSFDYKTFMANLDKMIVNGNTDHLSLTTTGRRREKGAKKDPMNITGGTIFTSNLAPALLRKARQLWGYEKSEWTQEDGTYDFSSLERVGTAATSVALFDGLHEIQDLSPEQRKTIYNQLVIEKRIGTYARPTTVEGEEVLVGAVSNEHFWEIQEGLSLESSFRNAWLDGGRFRSNLDITDTGEVIDMPELQHLMDATGDDYHKYMQIKEPEQLTQFVELEQKLTPHFFASDDKEQVAQLTPEGSSPRQKQLIETSVQAVREFQNSDEFKEMTPSQQKEAVLNILMPYGKGGIETSVYAEAFRRLRGPRRSRGTRGSSDQRRLEEQRRQSGIGRNPRNLPTVETE